MTYSQYFLSSFVSNHSGKKYLIQHKTSRFLCFLPTSSISGSVICHSHQFRIVGFFFFLFCFPKVFSPPRFCTIKEPGSDTRINNCSFKEENQKEGKISNTHKLKCEKYKMVQNGTSQESWKKSSMLRLCGDSQYSLSVEWVVDKAGEWD